MPNPPLPLLSEARVIEIKHSATMRNNAGLTSMELKPHEVLALCLGWMGVKKTEENNPSILPEVSPYNRRSNALPPESLPDSTPRSGAHVPGSSGTVPQLGILFCDKCDTKEACSQHGRCIRTAA